LPVVGGPQNRFAIRMIEDMKLQDSKEGLSEVVAGIHNFAIVDFARENRA